MGQELIQRTRHWSNLSSAPNAHAGRQGSLPCRWLRPDRSTNRIEQVSLQSKVIPECRIACNKQQTSRGRFAPQGSILETGYAEFNISNPLWTICHKSYLSTDKGAILPYTIHSANCRQLRVKAKRFSANSSR